MVRKILQRMFAAILVCGAMMIVGCSGNDDNPIMPDNPVKPDEPTEEVHLTQVYGVSTLPNGDTLSIDILDYVWEDGLLRKTHSYLNMPTYNFISESDYFYVYDDDGNCTEEHSVIGNNHYDYYFTYEGGLMTSGIEIINDEIIGKFTITGYTADGYVQTITTERLLTGVITDYEITWENGDMTAFTKYIKRPGEEEEIWEAIIDYDDYPNARTGMPWGNAAFDPQMIASIVSAHNWDLGAERFYSNGRMVKSYDESPSLTNVTYYTYSDGTTGRE